MQLLAVFMLFSALAVITSASSPSPKPYVPAQDLEELAKLMPANALPSPSGLKLKFVVLGVGTQNYTCASGTESDAPSTSGALARLYDIGTGLKDNPLAAEIIGCISPLAFFLGPSIEQLSLALRLRGFQHLLGHHFFHLSTPVFALDQLAQTPYPIAQVSKLRETKAPPSTFPGLAAVDSVNWLFLRDLNSTSQGGVDTVYRVETVGGTKPATCEGQRPTFEVEYAAQCKLDVRSILIDLGMINDLGDE
ncbi:repeatdomain containing protein [Pyrenophora tritici-repentis]|nr:DUF3455 domain-containing protein [Pyrenophora tritici-repentis]KAI0604170.1 DUF3455 domain-containing protein [Pyrenophora tritici-repentis]KAI0616997.1 DUF3455 domain-containing protein [Pyrenophora tritici-repentis]KAI1539862.1 repeatdomain containing protein [Pyrenophora tritici-repentis]PZD27997.1 DUF3455 domain containing protein [Pyrenophora tritici-repentis]